MNYTKECPDHLKQKPNEPYQTYLIRLHDAGVLSECHDCKHQRPVQVHNCPRCHVMLHYHVYPEQTTPKGPADPPAPPAVPLELEAPEKWSLSNEPTPIPMATPEDEPPTKAAAPPVSSRKTGSRGKSR